jgi:hypothetical protein
MQLSCYGFIVRTIAFFKLATSLIKQFHHEEGEFNGSYYGMHHSKNSGYYVRNKQSFLIDFRVYNPKEFKLFVKSFLRNILNFLAAVLYFPLYTHYYSIKGIVKQFNYLSRKLKTQDVLDISHKLEFHGFPHLLFSLALVPIGFILNCFVVEPLERFLYSFICVSVLQIIFFLKLVPYSVLLVASPFAIFIALTWVIIRLIYKVLVNAHKIIFKKINVA